MAEPTPGREEASPEMQLLARMKLQRVVFGAFAIVLVCLFALGLSAYRRMQHQARDAQAAEQNAELMARQARVRADQLERELQSTRNRLEESEHLIALLNCRLAMHEIRDGEVARARTLLDEARELGPPAWWPLAARLTQDWPVRFAGGDLKDKPILTGAISGDLSVVAVVRQVPEGVVLESWGAMDGKLKSVSPALAPADGGIPEAVRLALSHDGSAWFIAMPTVRYVFRDGNLTRIPLSVADLSAGQDAAAMQDFAANSELTEVYEAMGTAGLWRSRQQSADTWSRERVVLGPEISEVQSVCLAEDRPVFATHQGIHAWSEPGSPDLLHLFEQKPDRVALRHGAGVVYAAILTGRKLALLALSPVDAEPVAIAGHELPDENVVDLRFLTDDVLAWVGRSGRLITMSFSNRQEWTLGGDTLSFIERHPRGLVFANRKGELSLRTLDEIAQGGVPVRMVPPQFTPVAAAHGFLLQAPRSGLFAVQHGLVRELKGALSAVLTPQGPAYSNQGLRLPGGVRSAEEGVLLGAFHDGRLLLFAHKQKLKVLGTDGVSEFLLPGDRAPDATAVAARAGVAAVRVRDTVYVSDLSGDPFAVASRLDVAPDLLALSADGTVLAIAYGAMVAVHNLHDGVELTVRSSIAPTKLALLFRGTVLVTIEAGELVFYEVATGRELLRAGAEVTDLAASGDASLNLVAGGWLRELRLKS